MKDFQRYFYLLLEHCHHCYYFTHSQQDDATPTTHIKMISISIKTINTTQSPSLPRSLLPPQSSNNHYHYATNTENFNMATYPPTIKSIMGTPLSQPEKYPPLPIPKKPLIKILVMPLLSLLLLLLLLIAKFL